MSDKETRVADMPVSSGEKRNNPNRQNPAPNRDANVPSLHPKSK